MERPKRPRVLRLPEYRLELVFTKKHGRSRIETTATTGRQRESKEAGETQRERASPEAALLKPPTPNLITLTFGDAHAYTHTHYLYHSLRCLLVSIRKLSHKPWRTQRVASLKVSDREFPLIFCIHCGLVVGLRSDPCNAVAGEKKAESSRENDATA